MFSIEVDGIPELERDFRRIEVTLSDAARRAAEAGAREGVAEAKAKHAYTDRTGKLTGTATSYLEASAPGGSVAVMKWPQRYASFVENGTEPHMIVGNPTLTFRWKGVLVHFRYVNHPGSKAYPFAGPAMQKAERVIYRELEIGVFAGQRILEEAA
jgi:hypothetical protein